MTALVEQAPVGMTAEGHAAVDAIEKRMKESLPPAEFQVFHCFTPGLYSRRILMPAGRYLTSKIHRTEHQFVVMKGACLVRDNEGDWILYQAGTLGITKPGTRRVLFICNDCEWVTFHPGNWSTVEEVENDIIEKRDNPLLAP